MTAPFNEQTNFHRLIKALQRSGYVKPFVGAGFSQYGLTSERMPGWHGLVERAAERAWELNCIDEKTRRAISANLDVRQYAFAAEQAIAPLPSGERRRLMDECFDVEGRRIMPPAVLELVRIPWPYLVTTNYDHLIERAWNEAHRGAPLVAVTGREPEELYRVINGHVGVPRLLKLHGTIERQDTWILTNSEYGSLINNKAYIKALEQLYSGSLLFLGFGMSDRDFDPLLANLVQIFPAGVGEHFALLDERGRDDPHIKRIVELGVQPIWYTSDPDRAEQPDGGHDAVVDFLGLLVSTCGGQRGFRLPVSEERTGLPQKPARAEARPEKSIAQAENVETGSQARDREGQGATTPSVSIQTPAPSDKPLPAGLVQPSRRLHVGGLRQGPRGTPDVEASPPSLGLAVGPSEAVRAAALVREKIDLTPIDLAHTWGQLQGDWQVSADGEEFRFDGYKDEQDRSKDALLMSNALVKDGVLEAKVMVEEAVPHETNAHLVFRYQDPENYLFAGLGGWVHKLVIAERRPPEGRLGQAGWQTLKAMGSTSEIKIGEWQQLRVEFRGRDIALYLGGVLVLSHVLPQPRYSWPPGSVGVRAWGLWKARFRNVRAWQSIGEADGGPASPSEAQNKKQRSDVRGGIAFALTAFAISVFLYLQSQYFGGFTTAAAVALIALGFAGLGIELNRVAGKELDALTDRGKSTGVFDNLGIGLAVLVVWGAIYRYFPLVLVNVLACPLLLFGTYGTILGLINALFLTLIRPGGQTAGSEGASGERRARAFKVVAVVTGTVGFIASLIQLLQLLKAIP